MENEGSGRGQRRHVDAERPLIVEIAQLVLDLARVWDDISRLTRRLGKGARG